MREILRAAFGASVLIVLTLAGCGDDGDHRVQPAQPVTVGISQVSVVGSAPAANPVTNTATSADLNRGIALVYQADGVADGKIEKVLLLVPGFLAGASNFDYLGKRVVERSDGRVAVWAVDRRSNALEDLTGLDAAEAAGDPEVAKDYYFRGQPIGGKSFAGFATTNGSDISFLSEWTIRTHVEDLDALVTAARARYPKAAIILGGHSLGASIAPIYAAWDFGDHAGFERLSGILLMEGRPDPRPQDPPPSQTAYETTGIDNGFGSSSVAALRTGDPTSSIPFVTRDLFIAAEIVAMRASNLYGTAEELSPDADIIGAFFRLIFGVTRVPAMTNAATLGFGFDNQFQPLTFIRAALGSAAGPTVKNTSVVANIFGGDLLAPNDPNFTYGWTRRSAQAVPEPTDLATFAEGVFAGPSNFIEWYFPARITLDVSMVNTLNVARSGDWRKEVYGFNVTENSRIDLPIFAIGGDIGIAPTLDGFEDYRDSISPTLRNGASRSATAAGYQAMIRQGYAHIDPLTAADEGAGNGFFEPLVDWIDDAAMVAPRR